MALMVLPDASIWLSAASPVSASRAFKAAFKQVAEHLRPAAQQTSAQYGDH